ncbi:hypothetical protein GO495_31090 [Chitinophaga oryziterrae]|uniref:Uncharacterized protein n=1 Tax=Chitinophaga oryziterrae TaxID=1031224 RepID=A0A6N8JJC2_9BACT|nr:hypothetical protein [Chitinophaga oryziterrae]MVT45074.1 hypothetical protein [Chitinophaga oryziterrae]
MHSKFITVSFILFLPTLALLGQSPNPYKNIQKNSTILTLSKGQSEEFFDQDSIQQIGTALVNINSMQVVKLLSEEEANRLLDNSAMHRFLSVDPLSGTFPMLTPYQYASNSPIMNIDLDGMEGVKVTDIKQKTITVVVDVLYILRQSKDMPGSNIDQKQLERIQKNLNAELNREAHKDMVTCYDVKFDVKFTATTSDIVDKELNGNNSVQDPRMYLIMEDEKIVETKTGKDADGNDVVYTATQQGASSWRVLHLTSSRRGHTMAHELFHNLMHNHKNAPADITNQIDRNNQKLGHKKAGGIFIYQDDNTGDKEENINQMNIQDMLRSLPEKTTSSTTTTPSTTTEPPKE